MFHRLSWALTGALGIILVLTLARVVSAGPLDPPGPVGSTMRTIDELLPSWGKQLASSGGCASKRFTCVLPTASSPTGAAVLDHETGLVWQRDVSVNAARPFAFARLYCAEGDPNAGQIGDREGWRLPTRAELQTLRDFEAGDVLPSGHPFTGASGQFWTTTTDDFSAGARQWVVGIDDPGGDVMAPPADNVFYRYWCVRGGSSQENVPDNALRPWSSEFGAFGGCASARFTCVMNNSAVLDNETGLVWERTPGASLSTAEIALDVCATRSVGGRQGWRLPSIAELSSLLDATVVAPSASLPTGNPFNLGGTDPTFWTSTVAHSGATLYFEVHFTGDFAGQPGYIADGVDIVPFRSWCVRAAGGQ